MKIGIISQARMTSTRLPGKVLMLANSKTLLAYHIERLSQTGIQVYIATTTNDTDNPVAEYCEHNDIPYWRGSEHDVLQRYADCVAHFALDIVIRVTSDCPLIDPELIKNGLSRFLSLNYEHIYLTNTLEPTYPRGFDYEICFGKDLIDAAISAKEDYEREHVMPYLRLNKSGQVHLESLRDYEDNSHLRITVDTPEDYELIRKLIEEYHADRLNAADIIEILKQHPELVAINAHIVQKKYN